jgi:hypothetical protein
MRPHVICLSLAVFASPISVWSNDHALSNAQQLENAAERAIDAPYLVRVAEFGAWRAQDLKGKPIYDREGDQIGTVTDMLVTADASITALIVEASYLESPKTIGLKLSAFSLAPGDPQARADEVSEGNPAVAPAPMAVTAEVDRERGTLEAQNSQGNDGAIKLGPDGLPERLVADVTRQQVSSAPDLTLE